jgi:hypothetical protein
VLLMTGMLLVAGQMVRLRLRRRREA